MADREGSVRSDTSLPAYRVQATQGGESGAWLPPGTLRWRSVPRPQPPAGRSQQVRNAGVRWPSGLTGEATLSIGHAEEEMSGLVSLFCVKVLLQRRAISSLLGLSSEAR